VTQSEIDDAGELGSWLQGAQAAIRGEHDSDVPCAGCTACCRASQFVLVEPDEADTLARIPRELLFPAPQMPRGHRVLGYDERGHCPMLVDDRCTIYAHRPRACRAYDCRVFAATGVELDDETKAEVRARAERWRFRVDTPDARARADAVRAAATFLRRHAADLPAGSVPRNPTQLAALAIEVHEAFLASGEPGIETVGSLVTRAGRRSAPRR
jgi:Fe-S-cluster containining protein